MGDRTGVKDGVEDGGGWRIMGVGGWSQRTMNGIKQGGGGRGSRSSL